MIINSLFLNLSFEIRADKGFNFMVADNAKLPRGLNRIDSCTVAGFLQLKFNDHKFFQGAFYPAILQHFSILRVVIFSGSDTVPVIPNRIL